MSTISSSRNTVSNSSLPDSVYVSSQTSIDTTETIRGVKHKAEGREILSSGYYAFKKEIDKAARDRFQHVAPQIEYLLLDNIQTARSKNASPGSIAIKLKVIGRTEDEASLRLVVLCPSDDRSRIQRFFRTTLAKDLCEPADQSVPRLKYKVIGYKNGPHLLSAVFGVDVCSTTGASADRTTLCGDPIFLINKTPGPYCGERRKATLGGIIKVTSMQGTFNLYGITAGHAVREWKNKTANDSEDEQPVFSDDENEVGDGYYSDDELDGRLGSQSTGMVKDGDLQSALDREWSESWDFATDEPFGKILLKAADKDRQSSHDWALIEMKSYKPNELCTTNYLGVSNKQKLVEASRPPFQDGISDPVTMISGSHGARAGELSSVPARILIGSNATFINAYTLELNEGNGDFHLSTPQDCYRLTICQ
jgi:hypothetical protein